MSINLIKTYEDMIKNSKITQKEVDNLYGAIYMDYFLRPDLRLNQRAGHRGNGDFIEGLHIYPDKECICELLNIVQENLNKNGEILDNPDKVQLGMIRYLSELANYAINTYFGGTQNVNNVNEVFYEEYGTDERMAKLSDFKGLNCAECIERALATHIVLCVLANNDVIKSKNLFPYKSFIHSTNYCAHIDRNSSSAGHALCGLISEQDKKTYLLDTTNYGKIKNKNKEQYICGLYELTDDERDVLLSGGAIAPQLMYSKNIDGVVQLSHRAFSKRTVELKKLAEKYRINKAETDFQGH